MSALEQEMARIDALAPWERGPAARRSPIFAAVRRQMFDDDDDDITDTEARRAATIKARRAAAERAELIFTRRPGEFRDEQTARIMALSPWERALAVSALFDLDLASVFAALAAKYREPQS